MKVSLSDELSLPHLRRTSVFALIGACAYIAVFSFPFDWDIPLIALALMSVLAIGFDARKIPASRSRLVLPVLVFLVATGLSTLVSEDIGHSILLSAPLLPAVLLYFLVAEHFDGTQDVRILYITFSVVALGLAAVWLWAGLTSATSTIAVAKSAERLLGMGSLILVVPNDVVFLAIVAPFSLVLLCREPRSVIAVIAALSILLSIAVITIFQSRTAMLTMVASLMSATILVLSRHRLRFGLACGLVTVILVLLVDGLQGFASASRYISNVRIEYWLTAWYMFLDAPLLGNGPHTFFFWDGGKASVQWPHNLYLEVLAEQGIIGLTALTVLLVWGVSAAWNIQRTASSETRIFGAGALAGFIGFCGAAAIELTFIRQWVVIMMFTLLGVIANLSSSQTKRGRVKK